MAHVTERIRINARAFLIWREAETRNWDCTLGEIADALDETVTAVANICRTRGWLTRLRSMKADHSAHYLVEDHLDGMAGAH